MIEKRLTPIENGTVLDHLPPQTALHIVKLLNLDYKYPITIAINTESKKMGRKDLIFIEGKQLSGEEVGKISLIANGSTWNIIQNGTIAKKAIIYMPENVEGIITCPNSKCITNYEAIKTKFSINSKEYSATCVYCNRELEKEEIAKMLK